MSSSSLSLPLARSLASNTQVHYRMQKARTLLKQLEQEEDERLAELYSSASVQERGSSCSDSGPATYTKSARSRDMDCIRSLPPTLRRSTKHLGTLSVAHPADTSEVLELETRLKPPTELESNSYLELHAPSSTYASQSPQLTAHYSVDTFSRYAALTSFNGAPRSELQAFTPVPQELSSSLSTRKASLSQSSAELSALLSMKRNPSVHRRFGHNYLDSDTIAQYNTLPGEPFPLLNNVAALTATELAATELATAQLAAADDEEGPQQWLMHVLPRKHEHESLEIRASVIEEIG